MAKLSLNNIASGFASTATLNANFDAIETALENTLSRDGTTPNQMTADLDMNSNGILNLSSLDVASLSVNGVPVTSPELYVSELPAQATHGDKFLQTNGTVASWQIPDASEVSFTQDGTGAVSSTVESKLQQTVSVKDFGAVGDGSTDDTAAFKSAIASGASRIFIPKGTYLTDFTNPTYRTDGILFIPDGTEFFGEGENSVIRPYTNQASASGTDAYGCLGTDSGDVGVWSSGLVFRDLKFYGWSETTATVNEHAGLLALSSVKRVRIERCFFVAPRGDAIHISSGYGGGPANERHNYDVTIRDCTFDGVNNKNRNAITAIDIDGLVIDGCTFKNFSDTAMPGSIDLEPDESYSVIKNVRIINNQFYNTNGINGHISIATGNAGADSLENIIIKGNHFEDAGTNSSILLDLYAGASTNPLGIIIEGNTSINPLGDFIQRQNGYSNGIVIKNNISRHLRAVWFHYTGALQTDTNLTIESNEFLGVGASSVGLLLNSNLSHINIVNNRFSYSGNYHANIGNASGSSEYVNISGNEFTGTPSNGAVKHDAGTKNAATNTFLNNRLDTYHSFQAAKADVSGGNNPTGADEATAPSGWPYGVSMVRISSRTIDGATQSGLLYTYKQTRIDTAVNNIWQKFVPNYSATYKDDFYFRKAVDASTWDSWWQVTGI